MGNGVADIFNGLISHLTLDPIDIDNWNFKLHSKLSAGIFFLRQPLRSGPNILERLFNAQVKIMNSLSKIVGFMGHITSKTKYWEQQ